MTPGPVPGTKAQAPSAKPPPIASSPKPAPHPSPMAEVSAPEPAPPPAPDPGRANVDPSDDQVVAPPPALEDCQERLTRAGAQFREAKLPIRTQPSGMVCGTPQAVTYEGSDANISWNVAPTVSCQLALALVRFEALLQEEADKTLGARVARIEQGGTYSCRKMARFRLASEHSYANAIDLRSFRLSDGRRISVKQHFGSTKQPAATAEARFLRTVAERAYDENVFSVVLTPFWDALHADHFHVDQARYRVDGTRGN